MVFFFAQHKNINIGKEMCSEALLTQFHQNSSLHHASPDIKEFETINTYLLSERESDPIHYYKLYTYMECNGTHVR